MKNAELTKKPKLKADKSLASGMLPLQFFISSCLETGAVEPYINFKEERKMHVCWQYQV